MQLDTTGSDQKIQRTAVRITRKIGSPTSIIIHTLLFLASFIAPFLGFIGWDRMLLILTTIVSLEAIYLSLFIQMTVNQTTEAVEDISEDVGEIQEDIVEIQEDVEDISEDVEEISEDVGEISEDVEEITGEVEELTEEEVAEEVAEEQRKEEQKKTLIDIQTDLRKLMNDIERLKGGAQ